MYSVKNKSKLLLKKTIVDHFFPYLKKQEINIYISRLLCASKILLEKELSIAYKPKEVECSTDLRTPGIFPRNADGKIYSMILPPPNITGNLHLGHAINITIQDVLARWYRLNGFKIMWVPGFDHAGIATQVIVEKQLLKQLNKTRLDIGKEDFIKHVWNWKEDASMIIKNQLQGMGCLLNWEKEVFTLDSNMVEAVNEAFINLFEDGLIYRDNALVNWCCHLQSALSDIEVQAKEISGPTYLHVPGYKKPVKFGIMTEFAYKLADRDGEIIVATTRPETIHGDVAIAVSPKDLRYSHLRNVRAKHPFLDKTVPIIFDEGVNPEFGTGAVKITPGHDLKDFELSKRHDLPVVSIIDEKGFMNENCCEFAGMQRYEAREAIVNELKKLNLFKKNIDHPMEIPVCSRTGDIIEYLIRPQWFIKCAELAKSAIDDVEDGSLEIEPKCFEQNWFNWLNNIRDWCISRQLWWGHQIPVYECYNRNNFNQKIFVAARNLKEAKTKAISKLKTFEENIVVTQDQDVLDTWFSSALFPFAVHGWPQKTEDLNQYYPLNIMETGHDILFFWVARMVMLGRKLTGQLPFRKILLHGIICDVHGRKMSKSLGNTIEPNDVIKGMSLENLQNRLKEYYDRGLFSDIEVKKSTDGQKKLFKNGIPECGTDALRYTLCSKNIKSHFINFDINECHANKLFGNKIWQATKYTKLLINLCRENNLFENANLEKNNLTCMDLWILSKLSKLLKTVDTSLKNADFHDATGALKQFLYSELCDVYIETTKPHLRDFSMRSVYSCYTLILSLNFAIKHLSIFMPHISEKLLEALPDVNSIYGIDLTTFWPTNEVDQYSNNFLESNVQFLIEVVSTIRRIRLLHNISKKQDMKVVLEMNLLSPEYNFICEQLDIMKTLASCNNIEISDKTPEKSLFDTANAICCVHIITSQLPKSTSEQLQVEINKKNKLMKKITKLQTLISNEGYREKAPKNVQDNNDKKLKTLLTELHKLETLQQNKASVN